MSESMRFRGFAGHVLRPDLVDDAVPVPAERLERGSAAELRALVREGYFVPEAPGFLVQRVSEGGRMLTGVVAEAALDGYVRGEIRPHEAVRQNRVERLAVHRETVAAETTPVLAAYRSSPRLDAIVAEVTNAPPIADAQVGAARQTLWRVPPSHHGRIEHGLAGLPALYIIDGHHRVEAACRVAERRRAAGEDAADAHDHVLSVLVPAGELHLAPHHRWVRELEADRGEELLARIRERFDVEVVGAAPEAAAPRRPGEFAMLLDGTWYRISAGAKAGPVGSAALDVTLLQEAVLDPLLGIRNPDNDPRLEFVAGPEGLEGLARRCRESGGVAFALHPPEVDEVLAAADAGRVLPPKSTWFGPKPAPGLLLRLLDDPAHPPRNHAGRALRSRQ